MRVYVLHFSGRSELSRAFDRLMQSDEVASCMLELAVVRLRFLAPPKSADALVERIYEDGGLVWCSRHDISVIATD